MSGPLVIKVGGRTLGSTDTTYRALAALASAGDVPVVIHGGGAEASRWLERMSIPSRFERGLRVTDEAVLPVVVAVFAGLVNKRIVQAINDAGGRAVGISGKDDDLMVCEADDPELGYVGRPVEMNVQVLRDLYNAGIIPVVAPVATGMKDNETFNVNGDTAAGAAAFAEGLVGGGVPAAFIEALAAAIVGATQPDLTLIFDLPVEVGLERALGRGLFETRFESKGLEFHQRLRRGFLEIAASHPQRCVIIDADGDQLLVHYNGFDASTDEWVGPERVRPYYPAQFAEGDRVDVELEKDGKWYPARIERGWYGLHKVRYDGFDESSDEWVGPGKVRLRVE